MCVGRFVGRQAGRQVGPSVRPSVRPSHDITRLTTDGLSWNFILDMLDETCHDPTRLKPDQNGTLSLT